MAASSSTSTAAHEVEDEDEELEEPLQIETSQPQPSRAAGLLAGLFGTRKQYGQVPVRRRRASAVTGDLFSRCFGLMSGRVLDSPDVEDEPLLFALTWAQPQRYGIAPSPRNGHTMVLVGMHLYIFGGGDETVSFNDVHTLHVGSLTWDKPVVHGTLPSPRSRHSATAVGNNMVVFGGVGGGNDLHILETDTLTWYVPKVSGEPPLPRFGHSSTLVDSMIDQSRKLYIFGGHDGRRSLSDLHLFDTEAMTWSKAAVSGRAGSPGPALAFALALALNLNLISSP